MPKKFQSNEMTPDLWHRIRAEVDQHKTAAPVVKKWAKRLNCSRQVIYTNLGLFTSWSSGKKKRKDAGLIDPVLEDHLWNIAAIWLKVPDKVKSSQAESNTPLEAAVESYVDSFDQPPILPSLPRIYQIFRGWEISRKHTRNPKATRKIRSLYANQVHQYDTSVCRYWLNPDDQILFIPKSTDYKNKELKKLMKKRRLVRHVLIDHFTGAFFVYYSFRQRIIDYEYFLYDAWREKGKYIFHGAPDMLILDHDSGLRSHALMRLYKNLGIEVPEGKPYVPWEKGTVEGFNRIWERRFEWRFLFQQSGDLDQINQWAYDYAIKLQTTKKHRRHKHTRFDYWYNNIDGHLREIPAKNDFMKLAYMKPVPRLLDHSGEFSYDNNKYEVKDLRNQWVDVIVRPDLYEKNKAVTYFWPSEKESREMLLNHEIRSETILPVGTAPGEFIASANEWGTYSKVEPTQGEKNLEKVAKREIPEIKPFDHLETNVQYIPKKGKVIQTEETRSFGPITYKPVQALIEIRDRMGRRLTKEETAQIEAENNQSFTEDDIKRFVKLFKQGVYQRKEKAQ
jgi:hypothetical protein